MKETCLQLLGREDPQEEEMTAHSSILAWKILWKKKVFPISREDFNS